MGKRKEDMTPEEYQSVVERLKAARAKSLAKHKQQQDTLRRVEESRPAAPAAPTTAAADGVAQRGTPQHAAAATAAPATAGWSPELLDRYFEAKYKAKSKFMPAASRPASATPSQQAPEPGLVRRAAREEIQSRVNRERMALAFQSVFPGSPMPF